MGHNDCVWLTRWQLCSRDNFEAQAESEVGAEYAHQPKVSKVTDSVEYEFVYEDEMRHRYSIVILSRHAS